MAKRMHIPAMRRDINYIIVKAATLDLDEESGSVSDEDQLTKTLEDEDQVKVMLIRPWVENTGFHLLITPQGKVIADILMQRPGEASPGYNTEGILIGCVAVRGSEGKYIRTATPTQRLMAHGLVLALMKIFPKAVFKMGSKFVMNCKPEDIYNPQKDEEEEV